MKQDTTNTGKQEKPPRLIQWANDGYPPMDIDKDYKPVLELITAYKALSDSNKELREALQELYITHYEDTNAFRSEQVTALKNAKETLQKKLP